MPNEPTLLDDPTYRAEWEKLRDLTRQRDTTAVELKRQQDWASYDTCRAYGVDDKRLEHQRERLVPDLPDDRAAELLGGVAVAERPTRAAEISRLTDKRLIETRAVDLQSHVFDVAKYDATLKLNGRVTEMNRHSVKSIEAVFHDLLGRLDEHLESRRAAEFEHAITPMGCDLSDGAIAILAHALGPAQQEKRLPSIHGALAESFFAAVRHDYPNAKTKKAAPATKPSATTPPTLDDLKAREQELFDERDHERNRGAGCRSELTQKIVDDLSEVQRQIAELEQDIEPSKVK